MPASPNLCLCSQWSPNWCPFLSVLRLRQNRNCSLGSPLRSQKLDVQSGLLSLFLRKSSGLDISSQLCCTALGEKLWWVSLWIFLPGLTWLFSHWLGMQKSLNWFLDFSQWGLVSDLLLESVSLWGKGGSGSFFLPSC